MSIAFKCPKCGKAFKVKDELAGKVAGCPCGAKFKIPVPQTPPPPPPPKPVATKKPAPVEPIAPPPSFVPADDETSDVDGGFYDTDTNDDVQEQENQGFSDSAASYEDDVQNNFDDLDSAEQEDAYSEDDEEYQDEEDAEEEPEPVRSGKGKDKKSGGKNKKDTSFGKKPKSIFGRLLVVAAAAGSVCTLVMPLVKPASSGDTAASLKGYEFVLQHAATQPMLYAWFAAAGSAVLLFLLAVIGVGGMATGLLLGLLSCAAAGVSLYAIGQAGYPDTDLVSLLTQFNIDDPGVLVLAICGILALLGGLFCGMGCMRGASSGSSSDTKKGGRAKPDKTAKPKKSETVKPTKPAKSASAAKTAPDKMAGLKPPLRKPPMKRR